jgi:hypothetical protein
MCLQLFWKTMLLKCCKQTQDKTRAGSLTVLVFQQLWDIFNLIISESYFILFHPISSYFILFHPISSYFILFHPISKMFHNVSPSFSRDTAVWSQFGRAWNGARRLPRCCGFLLSKLAIKSGQSEALHHEFTAFPQKRFEHIRTLRRQPYRHTINIHRLHACDSF